MRRRALLSAGSAAAALLLVYAFCGWELFLPGSKRELIWLKNRTALPTPADYDPSVTLAAVLKAGDDETRWSAARAARIEGFVVQVFDAGVELANCLSFSRRDAHVEVALERNAPPRQRMILEVTPPMRDWAIRQGMDWSTEALRHRLVGRKVQFDGWLMFDGEHGHESENTNPGGSTNFRATAWELHPITSITVIE